jgi:2-polyprenyl-3-methyl-5-hydroxy-6-metoxy-1,4-benzoquinol methylase
MSPLSNAYLRADQLNSMEPFYPLHAYVCAECLLVQLQEYESPDTIFSDYAYFSSYSDSWLAHARDYVEMVVARFALGVNSRVVEIASNDGYLLQYFMEKGVPVLGVEPAANVAAVAEAKGVSTKVDFFGRETACQMRDEGQGADLVIGNNVLAHVPDINDFVAGLGVLLKPDGLITMEFPHLLRLIEQCQFDTIYHEHFSYLSLHAVEQIFASHGLRIFDVEELATHGGSLRIFACHDECGLHEELPSVERIREMEQSGGLLDLEVYTNFGHKVMQVKHNLLEFLIEAKRLGKTVVGYGAPAKGNTLLNYCGIRGDFIDFTVDRSPHKQDYFLPGTHIPVFSPERIYQAKPDYVLILPWNLKQEIMDQLAGIREWGGHFVVPIPDVQVF